MEFDFFLRFLCAAMLVAGLTSVASAIPSMDSSSLPSENFDDSSSSSVTVTTSLDPPLSDRPISDPSEGSFGTIAPVSAIEFQGRSGIWGYPVTDLTSSLNFDSPVLGGSFAIANYGPVSVASSLGVSLLKKTSLSGSRRLLFEQKRVATIVAGRNVRPKAIEASSAIPPLLICLFQALSLRRRKRRISTLRTS